MAKRVLIVHTGGTLGMGMPGHRRLDIKPQEQLDKLVKQVPELLEIADCDLISPFNLDSSDINPSHWSQLAELMVSKGGVGQLGQGYDGVVVIHGTDTMAFTASALALMLRNLDRPVVLTGSQRSLDAWRSDARANLASAVEVATMGLNEVVLVFGDLILRGCRSVKTDANSYRAFQAPGLSPLGTIGTQIDVDWERVRPASGDFQLQTVMDQRVMTVPLFPGLDAARVYDSVLASDSHHRPRAVVLKAFGVGNIPQVGFLPLVQALSEAEIPVIVGRQCLRGHTDLELYPGGRALLDAGVIAARDMTFEAIIAKAMWGLPQTDQDLASWFTQNIAGEINLG
ncbi:MAG: asparaginase [Myxococcota bacterium]|nr:asparaginase [Myxococcota bacterium]